jgi:DNA modification methylase
MIERMVTSSPKKGFVLDPFAGAGTTVEACLKNDRACVAYEINSEYCDIIRNRAKRFEHENSRFAPHVAKSKL